MTPSDPLDTVEYSVCQNPATGEIIGKYVVTPVADIRPIIDAAKEAQKHWSRVPVKQRSMCMMRVRDYMVAHADDIAAVISKNNGKTRVDAMSTEVMPAIMGVDYYAKNAPKFLRDRHTKPSSVFVFNKPSRVVRVPFGVIGIISPWNYPFAIPFYETVMGLLAGNAVVLKVSKETPGVGKALADCFLSAELPHGVFNHVNIPGRVAGSALLNNGIDKIFFTGSVSVGKALMREAAETLTPLVLELGGNDAMLVCDDADLDRAATGAVWAGLSNCGQSCSGVERIYVHQRVYQPFLSRLQEKVNGLRIGHDHDMDVDLGAMTTRRQIATVQRHLEDAVAKGAVIHARSDPSPTMGSEHFMPAYVLTNVHHGMLVMQEETFGPVVAVMKVKDMDQAVALANDADLGLSGSVWSRNRKKARRLARRIEAGVVMINDHLMNHGMPETTMSGFKMSGMGATHGAIGFDEMTRPQVIVDELVPFAKKNIWWHPHGKQIYRGLSGAINCLYAESTAVRLRGLIHLLQIVPRCFLTRR